MHPVFLSYRQLDDAQRLRVREFAERLRSCGITVILDQFYMDDHPGGPPDGWPKWSSDQAIRTERVLIIGEKSWFECFDGKQPARTGLGAACEAGDIRQRIYDCAGVNEDIRVVLFEKGDSTHVPHKLKGYHHFHAADDFTAIVKWLGGIIPTPAVPKTSIPHNLPTLQPFFGREDELRKIADALDPASRTWGALIDGPGGMGKTSLAVRAAYDASPEVFKRIIFISLKTRELDDDGLRDLSGFLISGLLELLNELARELGQPDIPKSAEDKRPRLLLDALRGTQTLLVLDNLESLLKPERDTLFTFVKKLPTGCKAILTSRGRIGSGAEELILEKLSERAALDTLAELATHNPHLAQTSEAERRTLYRETSGKPLLLRWTAGQLGRGHCLTFPHALAFIRSCPVGNDPLEFIFGDLVQDFDEAETKALCALTYFTQPAEVKHVAALVNGDAEVGESSPRVPSRQNPNGEAARNKSVASRGAEDREGTRGLLSFDAVTLALRSLVNRSLAVPNNELNAFILVPLVSDFLRKHRPEVVRETGAWLEHRAYALIVENGYRKHDRFHVLDAAWPTIAPAIPVFLAGENARLQTVCEALAGFFNFTGRWDEWLSLTQQAEAKALAVGDHDKAGWRAEDAGSVHYLRQQADAVLACADRAAAHWHTAKAGAREQATAINLRGIGHELKRDYPAAITAYREALDLRRSLFTESVDVASGLNNLAEAERLSGDFAAAERDYREALRVARAVGDAQGVAIYTGNLAALTLDREEWPDAEALAREALPWSEKVGHQELIAHVNRHLARALVRQGKVTEALPHAERAVAIFTRLGLPDLTLAQNILAECRAALLSGLTPGWTYNTTTLEGNTLTKAEVAKALADPSAKFPKRPPEHVAAARAQKAANEAVGRWLAEDRPFTKADLFALHTVLMQGSTVDSMKPIGTWKIEDNGTVVRLDGESQWNDNYAAAHHTDALMAAWLAEFNKRRTGAPAAFDDYIWLHATFARIHPFADGNGRLARLLATVPLIASGQPVVDIPAEARDRYLAALARWQFACGAPRPNAPLYTKATELKDFIALCKDSRVKPKPAKPARKPPRSRKK